MKRFLLPIFILITAATIFPFSVSAQQTTRTLTTPLDTQDPTSDRFMLIACDGPTLPTTPAAQNLRNEANQRSRQLYGRDYIPCDFNGVMRQVQHLINIAIVVGVLAAIVGFTYAGVLYITGTEKNINKAKEIFPKLLIGFIIMLSAWFIVYQLLNWLTGQGSGFSTLLGNP